MPNQTQSPTSNPQPLTPDPRPLILGVRHHGPGSARSARGVLGAYQPDIVLVEGPPDAAEVLPLLIHAEMQPPVALLVYVPEEPHRCALYPFAVFSPEWQAMHYGLTAGVPVRFMDLPQAHMLAFPEPEPSSEDTESEPRRDPLGYLAEAAGYNDSERWWEHLVEQRRDSADLFAAILEAMTELRQSLPPEHDPLEAAREAHMRQTIRTAQREGYQRIAVVCGAWHAPALAIMPPAKDDAEVLKGLPKVKVQATWVPWTYGRLTYYSGYGAGIASPGWYHHLWDAGQERLSPTMVAIRWLTRVAHLLRGEDLDASTAHVIEAVRLAESLAALRNRPLPGLPELNEAVQTVYCFGSDLPLRIIAEKLIIGERLGVVPAETPAVPLQQDMQREQRRLRLPPDPEQRVLDLDLRNETDLARSYLLHRLSLLGIPWGRPEQVSGKSGTFHELWRLQWKPEFAVAIIEAARWGNTVPDAATGFACETADKAADLAELSALLDRVLLSDLPDAVTHVMARLEAEAAVASDVPGLMDALPPLVQVMRYGNVRNTDTAMVGHVVDGLVARICIGLPGACSALSDDAAAEMLSRMISVNGALATLQHDEHLAMWRETLGRLADQQGMHGVIAGRSCRILHDTGAFPADEVARRMGLAVSPATDPAQAAAWVEGFLQGSGLILLHDDMLRQLLDEWIGALKEDTFTLLLPLLRRTFSTFATGERRQLGERAHRAANPPDQPPPAAGFDAAQADDALAGMADLFGM